MFTRSNTLSTLAVCLFAGFAAQGCLASQADIDQAELETAGEGEVASTEQALLRGGSNQQRLGYSCTSGTCTCDKSIENDCDDMTAVCTAGTVDGVITCINGWLTTHCTCKQDTGLVRPTTQPVLQLDTATTLSTAAILR
jgi:hypothetical protein